MKDPIEEVVVNLSTSRKCRHNAEIALRCNGTGYVKALRTWACCSFRQQGWGLFRDIAKMSRNWCLIPNKYEMEVVKALYIKQEDKSALDRPDRYCPIAVGGRVRTWTGGDS